ncbi:MAG: hypothetical protein K6G47_12025 [Clostridia bacterium]|nr:hypothetical protein [Clostridia bacterium]
MGNVFLKIFEMSISGGIAILAVLLLRLVFRRFPKKILILFWLAVAIRLIIPFNLSTPASVLNIGQIFTRNEAAVEEVDDQTGSVSTEKKSLNEDHSIKRIVQSNVTVKVANKATPTVSVKGVLASVWLSVALGLFVFFFVRYFNFYSKARWCSRSYDGKYFMTEIESPFVIGFLSPKIFVPVMMNEDEREYILNHEWTHIKNKDGLTKLICYFILCIHWFNPLVWLAYVMLCADMEMRVDEETTSSFDAELIKEYCMSIVLHASGTHKSTTFMQNTAFSGFSLGGMEAKLRVKNLLTGRKISKVLQVIVLIFALAVVFLLSTASYDFNGKKTKASSKKKTVAEETEETEPSKRKKLDDDESRFVDVTTESAEPTEATTEESEPVFQLFTSDGTWNESQNAARELNCNLVSIDSEEDWDKVTSLIRQYGVTDYIFYVGATRGDDGKFYWLSGEEVSSSHWLPGEPSGTGPTDDGRIVDEPYVAMFYKESDNEFYLMDVPDDMLDAASSYKDHIGCIVEQ